MGDMVMCPALATVVRDDPGDMGLRENHVQYGSQSWRGAASAGTACVDFPVD
jgi:hypothetical protein